MTKILDPPATQDFNMYEFNNPGGPPPAESEDCLYLNVFTPTTKAPATGRAVMVWVFGGGLQFGNGGLLYYDGSSFAANQDVIIVTPNYRTNGMHSVSFFHAKTTRTNSRHHPHYLTPLPSTLFASGFYVDRRQLRPRQPKQTKFHSCHKSPVTSTSS